MEEQTGWCKGCQRTLAELARWSVLDDDGKRAVWQQLALRRPRGEGVKP